MWIEEEVKLIRKIGQLGETNKLARTQIIAMAYANAVRVLMARGIGDGVVHDILRFIAANSDNVHGCCVEPLSLIAEQSGVDAQEASRHVRSLADMELVYAFHRFGQTKLRALTYRRLCPPRASWS